ncbi:superoxide dismutase [Pleurocapsales cyanobacterium LEGE 06147]|nr:superoxide dismutase [Pleurocapsales cyanobacterium LEGE 06147]
MPFKLQSLPYPTDALEPYIDSQTMQIHHDFHHGSYVNNLNKYPELQNRSLDDLIRNLNSLPGEIRTAIRNHGGGHFNHSIFWTIMYPNAGGEPTGEIVTVIDEVFGNFENFKTQFNDTGAKHFGSGFVWLVRTADGKFEIVSLPNQDCPWSDGHYPILCNDVWEHAYYLTYQNRRPEYLKQWWNTVNWDAVNERYAISQRLS